MKKEATTLITLFLIIFLAFVLRTYPYLNGYPYLVEGDSFNELMEAEFIEENHTVNWDDSYGIHPFLHLIVFVFSISGIPLWSLFHFLPQLISSLGILVFFLFLRKHLNERTSIIACFFLAVFGPNIWWGMQPVRESIGFFFLPLILIFFERELFNSSIKNKLLLALSFVFIILTHHWSGFIAFGFSLCFMAFLFPEKIKKIFFIAGIFFLLNFIYWFFLIGVIFIVWGGFFPAIASGFIVFSLLLAIAFLFYRLFFKSNKKAVFFFFLNFLKKKKLFFVVFSIAFVLFFVLSHSITVFDYPLQVYLSIYLLILFAGLGAGSLYSLDSRLFKAVFSSILFLFVASLVFFVLRKGIGFEFTSIDYFRTVEFSVYPIAFFASLGFQQVKLFFRNRFALYLALFLLAFAGLLIYPSVFVFRQTFEGTPLYDVRSDVKFISSAEANAMDWAESKGLYLVSVSRSFSWFSHYRNESIGKKAVYFSDKHYLLLANYASINDPELGMSDPLLVLEAVKARQLPLIYSSDSGKIYLVHLE